jgi:hypothetical protein
MPKTCLQLRFRVWGPNLNPEKLTSDLNINPSRTFQVGELAGRAAHNVAGWEWCSAWAGWDTDPIVEGFVDLFSPHAAILRSCADDGARVFLAVVGDLGADLVDTLEEADKRGYGFEENEQFAAFLDCDRVGVAFDAKALQFLAAISSSLSTHIDIDLDDGTEGCR